MIVKYVEANDHHQGDQKARKRKWVEKKRRNTKKGTEENDAVKVKVKSKSPGISRAANEPVVVDKCNLQRVGLNCIRKIRNEVFHEKRALAETF